MDREYLEVELVEPLHQIQTLLGMRWDALGELLVLQVGLHSEMRPELLPVRISLSADVAQALLDALPQAIAERPGAEESRQ